MKWFFLIALAFFPTASLSLAQLEPIPEERGASGLALQLRNVA